MAKWRDTRRFGPGPYLLGFRCERQDSGFPFNLAAIETIERLHLDRPITLLAGDNGTGKSTLLEAIAAAIGFAEQGGELERLGELPAVPRSILRGALVLSETSRATARRAGGGAVGHGSARSARDRDPGR